jgi:hypothetical protein
MDRTRSRHLQLDAVLASVRARFHEPRSCIVVLTNGTSLDWRLASMTGRLGRFEAEPPTRIGPWSHAVFGMQRLPARVGAGCEGAVRYRSGRPATLVDLDLDVPYAGTATAAINVTGTAARSIEAAVRHTEWTEHEGVIFYIRMTSRNGPHSATLPHWSTTS